MLGINLDPEQEQIVAKSIADYKGNVVKLESALGALLLGSNYGWRLLKIVHSPATYKSYEKILGISYQDVCPERTELSKKSYALAIADKWKSFWAVASGKKPIKHKHHIDDGSEIQKQIIELESAK